LTHARNLAEPATGFDGRPAAPAVDRAPIPVPRPLLPDARRTTATQASLTGPEPAR
jgi:hypothetical protein